MRFRGALLPLMLVPSVGWAQNAPTVVVFPFEARGVSFETARMATESAVRSLREDPSVNALGPAEVAKEAGINLLEQARGCDYDIFCLVEIARLLKGRGVVVGHVEAESEPRRWAVQFLELDVARAAMVETLNYWVEPDLEALRSVTAAGARRLVAPPDARLRLLFEPGTMRVAAFGDPLDLPKGDDLPWWSGSWRFDLSAEGYESESVWVEVRPGEDAVPLSLRLLPDPLHVPTRPERTPEPFGQPSKRLGSGVSLEEAGVPRDPVHRPSRFEQPLPWVVMGVGLIAAGAGSALIVDAQSQYDARAAEIRFVPGLAAPADVARSERDELRDQHLIGSVAVISGAALFVLSLGYFLFVEPPRASAP